MPTVACPWPFLARRWADRAYTGERVAIAAPVAVSMVGTPKGRKGIKVYPRRSVTERTFG